MKMSERLHLEAEKLERLTAELERSPAIRAFREEERAETLERRKAAAARLADLDREAAERIPAMIEDVTEQERIWKEHEQAGTVIRAALLARRAALSRARLDLDSARRDPEEALLETYDPRIDEAIEFFRKRLDYLRTPGRISNVAAGSERNIFTMEKTIIQESNFKAVNVALQYSQNAISRLESMRLQPRYDAEAVAKLKTEMPKIDFYETIESEKDLEKIFRPDDPFHQAARELNALEALAAKADEILKKPLALLQGKRICAPLAAAPATKAPAPTKAPPAAPGPQNRAYLTRR